MHVKLKACVPIRFYEVNIFDHLRFADVKVPGSDADCRRSGRYSKLGAHSHWSLPPDDRANHRAHAAADEMRCS